VARACDVARVEELLDAAGADCARTDDAAGRFAAAA
jgi:hypothetical protein